MPSNRGQMGIRSISTAGFGGYRPTLKDAAPGTLPQRDMIREGLVGRIRIPTSEPAASPSVFPPRTELRQPRSAYAS
ncbi:MAG: hypothetical protein ABEJ96_05460 [Thiohalorhabdaceae bacterium]